jgi:hypothetical protein
MCARCDARGLVAGVDPAVELKREAPHDGALLDRDQDDRAPGSVGDVGDAFEVGRIVDEAPIGVRGDFPGRLVLVARRLADLHAPRLPTKGGTHLRDLGRWSMSLTKRGRLAKMPS